MNYAEIASSVVTLMAIPERAGTVHRSHRMAVWRVCLQYPDALELCMRELRFRALWCLQGHTG